MNGEIRSRTIWLAITALLFGTLACNFGLRAATPPASPIPITTEAAGQLEDVWATAIAGSKDGQVSIVMTEQQLTSYIALKLAADPTSPLKDVQVFLRDGKMSIYATATANGISAPAEITLSATPTAEGLLEIKIEKASIGLLPIPASLRDSISSSINELITGQFGTQGTGAKITAVTIADGQMVVAGAITK